MLRILAVAVILLVGSILLIVVVGHALPKEHVAARAISVRAQPAAVFNLISDFKNAPAWRSDVQEVEILPDRDGHARFREKGGHGDITYAVMESDPPRRLVTRIDDKNLPFGGGWIFEIFPTADGCRLNITERGEIYNPVFRFVSRFILGYNGTLDGYLKSVSRTFGENVLPGEGTVAGR